MDRTTEPTSGLAAEALAAASQLLTLLCWLKGNGAWRGTLALLFFWLAAGRFRMFLRNESGPDLVLGITWGLLGLGLLIWFAAAPCGG